MGFVEPRATHIRAAARVHSCRARRSSDPLRHTARRHDRARREMPHPRSAAASAWRRRMSRSLWPWRPRAPPTTIIRRRSAHRTRRRCADCRAAESPRVSTARAARPRRTPASLAAALPANARVRRRCNGSRPLRVSPARPPTPVPRPRSSVPRWQSATPDRRCSRYARRSG